jgi:hypothetical protein
MKSGYFNAELVAVTSLHLMYNVGLYMRCEEVLLIEERLD